MVNYPRMRVSVDWDGDGFVHRGVRFSTPKNLLPNALGFSTGDNVYGYLYPYLYTGTSQSSGTRVAGVWSPSDYGQFAARSSNATLQYGNNVGGGNNIFFTAPATTAYTLQLRIRQFSGSPGSVYTVAVYNTSGPTLIASVSHTTAASHSLVSIPFNATSGNQYFIRFTRTSGSGTIEITGAMVLAGTHTTDVPFNGGTTLSSIDDLEPYLMRVETQAGATNYLDTIASEGSLNVTVNNADRLFSPENSASPLYNSVSGGNFKQGVLTVVEVEDAATGVWHEFWRGYLSSLEPQTTTTGLTAAIKAEQGIFRFGSTALSLPLLEDVTADAIIQQAIESGWVSPANPYQVMINKSVFRNGVAGVISSSNSYLLDEGINNYAVAGEGWQSGDTSPLDVIRDLLFVEQGFFGIERTGRARFWHRDYFHSYGNLYPDPTELNDLEYNTATYVYGKDLVNSVKIDYYPKETVTGEVWSSREPVRVEPFETKEYLINFEYEEGSKITVLSINPFGGVNPSTMTVTDTLGNTFVDGNFDINIILANGEATIKIRSFNSIPLHFNFVLQGQIIVSYGSASVLRNDREAQEMRGVNYQSYSSKLLVTEDAATDLADYLLANYARNFGAFTSFTVKSRDTGWLTRIRELTLGSRVQITETNTGATHRAVITGEQMSWQPGILTMKYVTRPADLFEFVVLDEYAGAVTSTAKVGY